MDFQWKQIAPAYSRPAWLIYFSRNRVEAYYEPSRMAFTIGALWDVRWEGPKERKHKVVKELNQGDDKAKVQNNKGKNPNCEMYVVESKHLSIQRIPLGWHTQRSSSWSNWHPRSSLTHQQEPKSSNGITWEGSPYSLPLKPGQLENAEDSRSNTVEAADINQNRPRKTAVNSRPSDTCDNDVDISGNCEGQCASSARSHWSDFHLFLAVTTPFLLLYF